MCSFWGASQLTHTAAPLQSGEAEECQGELRQLCIAVLHAHAGLRQRSAQLLLAFPTDPPTVSQLPPGELPPWIL